jgi:calmodulin
LAVGWDDELSLCAVCRRRSKRTEEKAAVRGGGKKKPAGTSDAGKRPQKCVIL